MKKNFLKINVAIIIIMVLLPLFAFSQKTEIKHVILIGLDGWGAYSIPKANMPTIKKAMENGAYTLHARSVLPSSSAVNWASMMMGAGPELHGFTEWGSKKPDLPSRILTEKYGMFPSIFGLLRDQKPNSEIGYFYEWEGMGYLMEKQAANVTMHIPQDSINRYEGVEKATEYIRTKKPTFAMIVFDQPDGAGHKYGHDTPEYYTELSALDKGVAMLVKAVEDAGMTKNTLFIFTADHGGINKGHGGKTMQEMEIPIIMCGPGVKKGFEITESVMIYDIAATIAYIFKLNVPQVWISRPIKTAFTF